MLGISANELKMTAITVMTTIMAMTENMIVY